VITPVELRVTFCFIVDFLYGVSYALPEAVFSGVQQCIAAGLLHGAILFLRVGHDLTESFFVAFLNVAALDVA
jgi:hypothetical protein